jgi:GT2 family glycosyltransferase/4-amino-4-deoxy-L-arabinose transferase-like glycosyltransferase
VNMGPMQRPSPRISVIIPVHNGGDHLGRCLEALARSTRPPDELIVVDDGSADDPSGLAQPYHAQIISLIDGPHGPARARNRGAAAARGEILVFVDADVAVRPDTLALIEQHLTDHPQIAALFGSYDADPPAPGLVTLYKNLLHHYVHQRGKQQASTFWAGCGAIRQDVFDALGGFDESYDRPSIEDIELGYRLRRAGHRVWLFPDLQVTHLKGWSLAGLLRSDILDRAAPWTRLIMKQERLPADLNLDIRSRLSALSVWAAVVFLMLGIATSSIGFFVGALLGVGVVGALNGALYRLFTRKGGVRFAAGAAGLHALYLLYSSLTFALIAIPAWLARRGLALLLAATLVKGVAWSIIVPPWHAPDEIQHFFYSQIIERFRTLQVEPDNWGPQEAGQLFSLVQAAEVRFDSSRPLDLSDRGDIASQLAALEDPAVKRTYLRDEGRGFAITHRFVGSHPPLYYLVQAVPQLFLERWSILVRLLAGRWVSVLAAVAMTWIAYAAGRELWPDRPGRALLLATLVSFHPMVTFCTAIVGNLALEMALFSACLLVSLRVISRGLTTPRALTLGALTGLGLLTKMSFLSMLPLLALLFVWQAARRRPSGRRGLLPWVWVVLLPVLISGWWYLEAVISGGDAAISAFGIINERPEVRLLPYLVRYGWITIYRAQLEMYWGNFGWLDTPFPATLSTALTWLTVAAVWTAGWWLARRVTSGDRKTQSLALIFLGVATLSLIAFYTYLDFRLARALGGSFDIQGRYYLPAVVGQMAWLSIGLTQPVPRPLRRGGMWLVGSGMMGLNFYALFRTIAPRYYGTGALPELLRRATVLQPVGYVTLLVTCALWAVLVGALLAALWGAFDRSLTGTYPQPGA